MYIPAHFEVTDPEEVYAFFSANSFGQLISSVGGRVFSSHLPFLMSDDRSKLIAHVARQNPQHHEIEGQEVCVSFAGPHDYISPRWYQESGVPTWNYQALHVYGVCRVFADPEALAQLVGKLTEKFEAEAMPPWQPEYNPVMLGAIVGIEITITEFQCKFKLSQNRPVVDRMQVIQQLDSKGSHGLAQAMQRNVL